jgi:hypothetical protein
VAVLLLVLMIGIGIWYYRGNKTIIIRNLFSNSNDRSFTNPFFNQVSASKNFLFVLASDAAT